MIQIEAMAEAAAWSALHDATPANRRQAIEYAAQDRGEAPTMANELDAIARASETAADLEQSTRENLHRDIAKAAGLALFESEWITNQIARVQRFGVTFEGAVQVLIRMERLKWNAMLRA